MVGRNLLLDPRASDHEIIAPARQQLDLSSYTNTLSLLQAEMPDIVVHLAGKVGGIRANIENPFGFFSENLSINYHLIKAAKEAGIKRLINFGSSCMYPKNSTNPLTEDSLLSGVLEPTNEGYALAKIMAQRMCSYINEQFNDLQYKTIIPCNIFGPFDKFDDINAHLIPAIIRKLHHAVEENADNVKIWGDGTARREFIYVGDIVALLWDACVRFDSLPILMNAGISKDYSIKEYYEIAASEIGYKGQFSYDTNQPTGMKQKLVSSRRARQWGWEAQTELGQGISKTYEFYKGLPSYD